MKAVIALSSVVPLWALWIATGLAVVAAGLGPLASWLTAQRLSRMALVAGLIGGVLVVIGPSVPIDPYCPDWMPLWWCLLLP